MVEPVFEVPGASAAWSLYPRFAELSAPALALAAAMVGAAVGWAGWKAGSRSVAIEKVAAA